MTRTPVLLAAGSMAALSLLLAGCSAAGGGSTGGGSTPAPVVTDEPTAGGSCFEGEWSADVDDLAQQVAGTLSSTGMNVVSAAGTGGQQLSVGADGALAIDVDMTFTIVVDLTDGLQLQVTQHHTGEAGANWAWDDAGDEPSGAVLLDDFSASRYHVDNTFSMNGESSSQAIPIDMSVLTDVPMQVACSGDTLSTNQPPSPYTTHWTRVG